MHWKRHCCALRCCTALRVAVLRALLCQGVLSAALLPALAVPAGLQDVEGFELQVLEGAQSLLAKYNVNYVVAECTFGGEPRQRQMLK
jgi:hypothetical protein